MTALAADELLTSIPPIVLEQQMAIAAALELASTWEEQADGLQKTADYTFIHGTSMVADRYAMRARTLKSHAAALRKALAGAAG